MTGEPHVATVLFALCRFSQEAVNPARKKRPALHSLRVSIFNEMGRRDLLDLRIAGYAPGWPALTLGLGLPQHGTQDLECEAKKGQAQGCIAPEVEWLDG